MINIGEIIISLSDLVLFIIYGFLFLKIFLFTASIKSSNDIEHILVSSVVIGFIIDNFVRLCNLQDYASEEVYVLIIIVISVILGYTIAKLYKSKWFNNCIFNTFKINGTTDFYIWDSIINGKYPVLLTIHTADEIIIKGFLDLVEEYTEDPHVTIANFKIIDESGNTIRTSRRNETICFDLKNAKYYEFAYYKDDEKMKELQELNENNYQDYEV